MTHHSSLIIYHSSLKNMSIYDQYETVIGLEVHVQLSTESKAFCADSIKFGGEPNTQTSVLSLAHPGTLPRLNKRQVEYAVRLGLALGSEISRYSCFDRKNYFYADLPKGYQITQDKKPICIGGTLAIGNSKNQTPNTKHIRLHHIHMEEDAGKSIHDQDPSVTFIDLNRAGTPLLEIVTEPDFRSGEDVDVFMTEMRRLVRWLGISDGNMEEGSMRCDVNISVRKKGSTEFGTRCEVKNVNSMRFARKAIEFETKRQIDLIENGGEVKQNTLNFDPATGITAPLRSKENAHDYRYFPDPDLPPVVLTDEKLKAIQAEMPVLPWHEKENLIKKYGLTEYDATLLTDDRDTVENYQYFVSNFPPKLYKPAANLFINKFLPTIHSDEHSYVKIMKHIIQWQEMLELIESGKIGASAAYQKLYPAILETPSVSKPVLGMAEALNLLQSDDSDFLETIVKEVIAANPEKVAEYKKGKKGLIGFFMGEVMKASKGKAEPKTTNALILKLMEN
jgi:aspartyl-tRNA(Asn)/glutamyl-tRNA(Gln) amidotransferase subunit B